MIKKLVLLISIAHSCIGMHAPASNNLFTLKNQPLEIHNKILEYLPGNDTALLIFARHHELSDKNIDTIVNAYVQKMETNIQIDNNYKSFSPLLATSRCEHNSKKIANELKTVINTTTIPQGSLTFRHDSVILNTYNNTVSDDYIEEKVKCSDINMPNDNASLSALLFLFKYLQHRKTNMINVKDVPYSFCFRLPKQLATTINNVKVTGYGQDHSVYIVHRIKDLECCFLPLKCLAGCIVKLIY